MVGKLYRVKMNGSFELRVHAVVYSHVYKCWTLVLKVMH